MTPLPFKKALLILIFSVLSIILVWAYLPTLVSGTPLLAFRWEGAVENKLNTRDAGKSINDCAGQPLLPEGLIYRSSGFFSGWFCSQVGDPKRIFSLNYSDAENRRYYCRTKDGYIIGESFQQEELSDLEFVKTWDENPQFAKAACRYLREGIQLVEARDRFLYHCDAGRDRTGAIVALLSGWILEKNGPLSDEAIEAIECDYRKSESLKPYKYGRVKTLLHTLRNHNGGVRGFLKTRCGIE